MKGPELYVRVKALEDELERAQIAIAVLTEIERRAQNIREGMNLGFVHRDIEWMQKAANAATRFLPPELDLVTRDRFAFNNKPIRWWINGEIRSREGIELGY